MSERTRDELLDELVRMTNARDLLANTVERLIEERDKDRQQLAAAVSAAEKATALAERYGEGIVNISKALNQPGLSEHARMNGVRIVLVGLDTNPDAA